MLTHWRSKPTSAPPSDQHRQPTPELTLSWPGTPPAPPKDSVEAPSSEIETLRTRYGYSHTSLPRAQFFYRDVFAQDSQHDNDFNPIMLTDEESSTG